MRFDISAERPLRVIHYHFSRDMDTRFDMHYGLEFGVLLAGGMRRFWRDHESVVKTGDVWFCGMWEPHGWAVSRAPCKALVLIVEPSFILRVGRELHTGINWLAPFRSPPSQRPQISPALRSKTVALAKSFSHGKAAGAVPETRNCLKMLELLLLSLQSAHPSPMHHADEQLAQVDRAVQMVFNTRVYISTKSAACRCGMNRNAFAKLFNDIMGIQFCEFALRHRVSGAARDIASCGAAVKRAAADWGFADPSHFYRCFQKYYQCAPSDWMRAK